MTRSSPRSATPSSSPREAAPWTASSASTNLLALLLETLASADAGRDRRGDGRASTRTAKPTLRPRSSGTRRRCARDRRPIEAEVLTGDRAGRVRVPHRPGPLRARRSRPRATTSGGPSSSPSPPSRSSSGSAITAGEQALWKLGGGQLDGRPAVTASVPELPALPTLRRAAARAGRGRASPTSGAHRRVDPVRLLLRDGFWYLLGRDHGHDELRTYRRRPHRTGEVADRRRRRGASSVPPASIRGTCSRPTPSTSASSSTRASRARVRIAPERAGAGRARGR